MKTMLIALIAIILLAGCELNPDYTDDRLIGGIWIHDNYDLMDDATISFFNDGTFTGSTANPAGNNTWNTDNGIIYFTNFSASSSVAYDYEFVDNDTVKINDVEYNR